MSGPKGMGEGVLAHLAFPLSEENTPLDLDDHGGRTFLRVLLHLTMHDYPPLVSGALQLLFRHFSQRQEVLQAFKQVGRVAVCVCVLLALCLRVCCESLMNCIRSGSTACYQPRCRQLQTDQTRLGPTAIHRGEVRALGVQRAGPRRGHGRCIW